MSQRLINEFDREDVAAEAQFQRAYSRWTCPECGYRGHSHAQGCPNAEDDDEEVCDEAA